jgi:hypothetical protein
MNLGKAPLGQFCMPAAPQCDLSTQPTLTCTDGWSTWTHAFFTQNCSTCHDMVYDTEADARAIAETVRLVVERGDMPPPFSGQVSESDRRRLAMWFACGSMSPPGHAH